MVLLPTKMRGLRFWFCFPGLGSSGRKKSKFKPQYVDQYHTFRSKIVRKPMPCDVCRQPIYREGSCCKVCKYVCHKTCEPRVYSSCDTPLHYPLSNDSLSNCTSGSTLANTSQLRKSQTFPTEHHNLHLRDRKFRPQTIEMDITFITERIISMSFPMTGMDDSYRNSLLEVTKMLRTKHGENYTIFNLSERRNDMCQMTRQLMEFGWPDPLAPPLERLCSICKAVDSWINLDTQNVAVFHCKGGKERIAVVVAAYMHYSNICASADQALDRFAMKKFYNDKLGGLTTPSHKRYINYFNGLLSGIIKINSNPLYLHQILLHGAPNFDMQGGCRLFVKVYQGMKPVFTSGIYNVTVGVRTVSVNLESPIPLKGDILVKGYHRRIRPDEREIVFRCQFHTCAVSEYSLSFDKEDLDDAGFDNRFPDEGCLEFKFSPSPERHYVGIKDVSVPVDHSPDPIVRRDSYENLDSIQIENLYDSAYIIQPNANVNHTVGPLDGSPYATVLKKNPLENGLYNGIPHTASTDSGISSTTPPHSGRSATSNGNQPVISNGVNNVFETKADVHGGNNNRPTSAPTSDEQKKLDELLDGMLAQVETIPDLESRKNGHAINTTTTPGKNPSTTVVKRVTYSPETNGIDHGIEEDIDERDLPYHARDSSQPFSYLVPGSSPGTTRRFRPNVSTTTTITLSKRLNPNVRGKSPPPPFIRDISPPPPPPLKSATLPAYDVVHYKPNRSAYDEEPNLSDRYQDGDPKNWLRRQQEKLRERQEAQYRRDRSPKERLLFRELRTAQSRMPRPPTTSSSDEDDDDLIIGSEHRRPLYVNTYTNGQQKHPSQHLSRSRGRSPPPHFGSSFGKPPIYGRGTSAPNSPLIPSRNNSSREATRSRYPTWQGAGHQGPVPNVTTVTTITPVNGSKPLVRQRSDVSFDRERPFVAVMRSHELNQSTPRKPGADPFAAISTPGYRKPGTANVDLGQSPQLQRSQGLLATVDHHQPRTSSPISGRPHDELDFTTSSSRRSPQNPDQEVSAISNWSTGVDTNDGGGGSPQGDRPPTPGFPVHPRTPYSNQELTPPSQVRQPKSSSRKDRSPSPGTVQQIRAGFQPSDSHPHTSNGGDSSPSIYYGQSRRSSISSLNDTSEVIHHHPVFVKETTKYWYKPSISREDAINVLKDKPPGTFLVRDSNSFPGAYGLALKVSSPPPNVQTKSSDTSSELVRHFLIEPTSKGVKLKGCSNEPVFGTLSALVYQHSITPLALPCKLILPETDQSVEYVGDSKSQLQASQQLLIQGAACSVLYLFTLDIESLTGPSAVKKAVAAMLNKRPLPDAIVVHFKVSSQGITLTDSNRLLFFRRHYPVNGITHCGLDPDDRRWAKAKSNEEGNQPVTTNRVFGFVARKPVSNTDNQCHIFAELEPEQPATAIVNFVTKVMMSGSASKTAII